MSLAEKINIDVKNALKAGDKKLLAVSRNVLSELKNLLIKENLERDISIIHLAKLINSQELPLPTHLTLNLMRELENISKLKTDQLFGLANAHNQIF